MSDLDSDFSEAQEELVRLTGRVKWFDVGKGYGFVIPDDPSLTGLRDVLLHVTSLRTAGHEAAPEGSAIVCDAVRRAKGWQVAELVSLDDSTAVVREERPSHLNGDSADRSARRASSTARRVWAGGGAARATPSL